LPTTREYDNLQIFKNTDIGSKPVRDIGLLIESVLEESREDTLEAAITFYTLNNLAAIIKQKHHADECLGDYDNVYREYCTVTTKLGLKALVYMIAICIRESRHLGQLKHNYKTLEAYPLWADLTDTKHSLSRLSIILRGGHGDIQINDLIKILLHVYYDHSWSASFGGKAWGKITEQLGKLMSGSYTLELFLDTCFTLAHNTGNIFNKGFLFESVSGNQLTKILNVQRAGQMPMFVLSDEMYQKPYRETLRVHILAIKDLQTFGSIVDWNLINNWGVPAVVAAEKPLQEEPMSQAIKDKFKKLKTTTGSIKAKTTKVKIPDFGGIAPEALSQFTLAAKKLAEGVGAQVEGVAAKDKIVDYAHIHPALVLEKIKIKRD